MKLEYFRMFFCCCVCLRVTPRHVTRTQWTWTQCTRAASNISHLSHQFHQLLANISTLTPINVHIHTSARAEWKRITDAHSRLSSTTMKEAVSRRKKKEKNTRNLIKMMVCRLLYICHFARENNTRCHLGDDASFPSALTQPPPTMNAL